MKNILLFLSLLLMSLLNVKGIDDALHKGEEVGMESVFQIETSAGYILPLVAELPDEGEAYVDTESLARQYRICGRGQRTSFVQQMFFGKESTYRAAKKHLDILFHTINHVYTSLPYQSWSVSSDHYVFGMRHILI